MTRYQKMRRKLRSAASSVARHWSRSAAHRKHRLVVTCSTAELVARHFGALGFTRADLLVVYMALQEARGAQTGGMDLLNKLLLNAPTTRTPERALLEVLRRGPISQALIVPQPLLVSSELQLFHDVTGLALAVEAGAQSVNVEFSPRRAENLKLDSEWLAKAGFSVSEVDAVKEAGATILEKLGLLAVPWDELARARDELRNLLPKGQTLHGRGDFYQSCDELVLHGQRSTRLRFEHYGLESLLNKGTCVLDIGCNAGFFALRAAKFAEAVDGFDISESFINIATRARKFLGRNNANFSVSSFDEFAPRRAYNVIFSFAVHHWIGMPLGEYAGKLKTMLAPGGVVLLESQDLVTHDHDFGAKLSAFCGAGFHEVRCGMICDDGLLARKFVLLRDSRAC